MGRTLALALAGAASLLFSGCTDWGDNSGYDYGYGYGGIDPCTQFRSCGACTPIIGCGWCSYGKGQGICLSEPNACRTSQFSWTWDMVGCPGEDAGSSPPPAGDASTSTDASADGEDAGTD